MLQSACHQTSKILINFIAVFPISLVYFDFWLHCIYIYTHATIFGIIMGIIPLSKQQEVCMLCKVDFYTAYNTDNKIDDHYINAFKFIL